MTSTSNAPAPPPDGPPFIATGIDHLVLWVGDLEAARAWYCAVLGCRPGYEYDEIGMTHLWHGPILLGLWDASDPRAAPAADLRGQGQNVHHVAFGWQGASEEAVRAHLDAHGVTVLRERRQVGSHGFGLALYFNDPWGNLIELKGPPDQVPPTPIVTSQKPGTQP